MVYFCDIICKYYTMKKLSVVFAILVVTIFVCGFAPKEKDTIYFTIYYNSKHVIVSDKALKPAWYNLESHRDFTKGKTIYERAESAKSISKDFPEIHQILKKIQREIERKPFDGNIHFDPAREEKFWVTDAHDGIQMDIAAASREILDALKNKKHADIVIKTKDIEHKTEAKVLDKIGIRAQYSTRFDARNVNRSSNIALSVACFNGLKLLPGEVLSFNRTVGPRTAARGYEEANVIIDGEFVPGVGGGVCQTSTTLFNAALLSGLTIVKSQNHSLPISYVPLGRDAMVSSVVDLKMENNTGAQIYFEAGIEKGNRVFVKIYGNKLGNERYKPVTEVDSKSLEVEVVGSKPINPEEYRKIIIESGVPERSARTYLESYEGNRLVSRKLIRKSHYKGRTEIVRYEKIPETVVEDVIEELLFVL